MSDTPKTQTTDQMKLTPTQIDILDHRMSLGAEHIAECIWSNEEFDPPTTQAEAEAACASVEKMLLAGFIPLESLTLAERRVMDDLLDGSTYFANEEDAIALGETTRSKSRTRHKAADELETAFTAAFGERVRCARS